MNEYLNPHDIYNNINPSNNNYVNDRNVNLFSPTENKDSFVNTIDLKFLSDATTNKYKGVTCPSNDISHISEKLDNSITTPFVMMNELTVQKI